MTFFYITGLPRSRTAWLSVAMSDWQQSACLHEPLLRWPDSSMETVAVELALTRTPFVGISDSGLPVMAPDLVGLLPGPALIVWRDPMQVIDALRIYLPNFNVDEISGMVALLHHHLIEFERRYKPMIVRFDELADERTMRLVWSHLLPGVKFQKRRIASLQRLRIDPAPEQLLDGVYEQRVHRLHGLMAAPASV